MESDPQSSIWDADMSGEWRAAVDIAGALSGKDGSMAVALRRSRDVEPRVAYADGDGIAYEIFIYRAGS